MKLVNGKSVYTVGEVNALARSSLENLSFWVEAEISSFKGHNTHYRYLYFDLKDSQTGFKLPCIMEPELFTNMDFELEDGKKVLALGNLTLWEKEARLQMYILNIEDFGLGELLAEFEKLKRKLEQKGYFRQEAKKQFSPFPTNVAVISSSVSDAWQDFKKHSVEAFPIIRLTLFDVMVQGLLSPAQITRAIKKADRIGFDVIVIVRGGGSAEDLAAFNDEVLAKAIYEATTPIIVGVGHEKDITVAALVADIGASTPTDAAKILTADFVNLLSRLADLKSTLTNTLKSKVDSAFQFCDLMFHRLLRTKDRYEQVPRHLNILEKSLKTAQNNLLEANSQKLKVAKALLSNSWKFLFLENKNKLDGLSEKLKLLSPEGVLKRGYSITYDSTNHPLKDSSLIEVGDMVKIKLLIGQLKSKVVKKDAN